MSPQCRCGRGGGCGCGDPAFLAGLMGRRPESPYVDAQPVRVPLVGVDVSVDVHDFVAEVQVSQYYRNSEVTDIEATYHFPLDQASSVCGFRAEYEDGVLVNGEVKETEEARREYDLAISRGQQAQLLEEIRPDIFTVTVGRLAPNAHICIRITYITTLKAEGDESRFSLPTHIADRYSPRPTHVFGSPVPVPHIPATMSAYYKLSVKIKYSTRSRIVKIHSPSHPSDISVNSKDKTAEVSLTNIALSKELVVLCEEEAAHQPRACVEIAEDGSLCGLVTIFPKLEFRDVEREIIFIIDQSGSMGFGARIAGSKSNIQQAAEALLLLLRALPSSCTFNVIGFGSNCKALFSRSRKYDDASLAEATVYAQGLKADMGGTELLKPLSFALDPSASLDPPPVSNLLSPLGIACPGKHVPALEAAAEAEGVCSVCNLATARGERQARCSACGWLACEVCCFGCRGRHELVAMRARQPGFGAPPGFSIGGFCDMCRKTLVPTDQTMSCRVCDWDACSECFQRWQGKRNAVFGVTARTVNGCPGMHALTQSGNQTDGWNCDVCKRMLAPGEPALGCRTCDWDACRECAFGCRQGHELSVQSVGVEGMFCDVCARTLQIGEATMGCRTCDWDACGTCFTQWRDKRPAPQAAHQEEAESKRQRQVFVLTDGQVSNESEVFDLVGRACSSSPPHGGTPARVFCLGIGGEVSHHLVEGIARHGKGTAAFVGTHAADRSDGGSMRSKVLCQLKQALQPTLDDVTVTWNLPPSTAPPTAPTPTLLGTPNPFASTLNPFASASAPPASGAIPNPFAPAPAPPPEPVRTLLGTEPHAGADVPGAEAKSVRQVPSVCPPVFNRERFLSFALFPPGQLHLPLSVTVTAATPDGPLDVTLDIKPQDDVLRGTIAHRIAARARIRELEDECFRPSHTSTARPPDMLRAKNELRQLALKHRLVSSLTSFVAVRSATDGARHTFLIQRRTVPQNPTMNNAGGFWGSTGFRFGAAGFGASSGASGSANGAFGAASFGASGPPAGVGAAAVFASAGFASGAAEPTRGGPAQAGGFGGPAGGGAMASQAKRGQEAEAEEDARGVLGLCLLQRADGSFLMDKRLAEALGWELADLEPAIGAVVAGSGSADDKSKLGGTMAAIAGFRILHAEEQEVWELHEGKAMAVLMARGISAAAIDACVAAIRARTSAASKKAKP